MFRLNKLQRLSKEDLEKLNRFLEELKTLNCTIPIIAEGEHDVETLRNLGLKGNILKINTGRTVVEFADMMANKYKEVILLMDWDRKGWELTERLNRLLEGYNIYIHHEFREMFIKKVLHIRSVEELYFLKFTTIDELNNGKN